MAAAVLTDAGEFVAGVEDRQPALHLGGVEPVPQVLFTPPGSLVVGVGLAAGHRPILLPPRLASILQRLATIPPPRLTVSHGHRGPHRLFPSRVPGQPIANHALTTRLAHHGIRVRTARNGALAALAADLPAPILADLLGMHINTAVRWVTYARRDWADYLSARAAEQKENDKRDKKEGNSARSE